MADTVGAAQLAITADASGVEAGVSKAKKSLATLGGAAKAAGTEASKGVDGIGKSSEQSSQKVDRATKQMINAIQRTTAVAEAGSRSSAKYFEALAGQRGVDVNALRPYLDQLDAAAKKQTAATVAARAVAPAVTQVGLSAKQTAAALRGVPAQFTDIVTALSAGQRPLQVFLQQGGQLKDMFGGIGPAARALGGYMLGLLNPITLATGAVAALGIAYFQGAKEAQNYARAIILSGNAAGVTAGEMQLMAERISAVSGTQRAAAAALAEFVQNGTIAGDQIERFTAIALKMEKEAGVAVSETVKQFAELGKSPVEASTKLNEATNFLTASVARQIRMLEEQGRAAEAGRVAQEAYAAAMESRLPQIEQNLGLIERAWRAVGSGAKWAWDQMLGIGRGDTLEKQLQDVQKEIAKADGPFDPSAFGGNAEARARLPLLREQERRLLRILEIQRGNADAQAEQSAQVKAQLEFDKRGEQFLSKKARMEREITEARNLGAQAGLKQEEIEKRVAAIREKYADKATARAALKLDRAELGLDIERIRGEAELLVSTYGNTERRLESLRSAGLVSEQGYFEAKRQLIAEESEHREDALQQEIARLEAEKLTGAEKVQNDRKIADAQARLAIVRADTASKLEELSDRQVQATRREAAEFDAARRSAEDYFAAVLRSSDQELAGFGKGRRQREIDRGAFQIDERYGQERERLAAETAQLLILQDGQLTEEQKRRQEQRLALLNEYHAREIQAWTDHHRKKQQLEQDWRLGAQEGLANYADSVGNVAANVEEVFGNAFRGMEDALVQFAMTGKISFSGLVRSILADLARLQARQALGGFAKVLAGVIGSAIGGGVSGGGGEGLGTAMSGGGMTSADDWMLSGMGRAIGGPVSAGRIYRVNERRPELLNVGGRQFLMMGNQSGTVKPGGGGIHIVNNTQGRVDRVEERTTPDGDRVLVLEQAMVGWLADPNSRVSRAIGRNTTAKRSR